jgi:hypothetical protein
VVASSRCDGSKPATKKVCSNQRRPWRSGQASASH